MPHPALFVVPHGSVADKDGEVYGLCEGDLLFAVVGKCPFLGILNISFKDLLEIIHPNSRVMFDWDIYQPLFP